MNTDAKGQIDDLVRRHPSLAAVGDDIEVAFDAVRESMAAGGILFLCGNGGSAADAEHIAGELLKGFLKRRPLDAESQAMIRGVQAGEAGEYLAERLQGGLRAVTLTGHPSLATAVANDTGADLVFAQQLKALGRPGDVLLGISTSGNARNVCLAAVVARALQMRVVALTGEGGGQLGSLADVTLAVPARATHEVQELHLPVYHTLCAMLEDAFFPA